ncbi:MAG: prenyltransferase/squalene oxidase repeat-containing protein [Methanocellales archaeon]
MLNWRNAIRADDVVRYIYERQNIDGGYTFARGAMSSAQDTYYAVEILKMLNAPLENVDKTILFLQSLQHQDGGFDSIKVAYYAIATLSRLGAKPLKPLDSFIYKVVIQKPGNKEVYIEVVSEIENLCLSIELLNKLNLLSTSTCTAQEIFKLQNSDGSFGSRKYSRIASTYYALRILKILNYDVATLHKSLNWIKRCEIPDGGFAAAPELSSPYKVLEDIYYGVKSLELLNSNCSYPLKTLELIKQFQNGNGGFRRSIFLGISDFESTYQALSSIEAIQKSLGN